MLRRNIGLEARLIDDLLDLTRISRDKLSLNLETLDLHDLLTSVVGIIRADVSEKRQQLSLALNARNHFVRGDSARLQQVMWNVLKNAVKFTPAGGTISIHTVDLPEGSVTLKVTDTGIGMSPDTLARLFNPFEQGDNDTKRLFGGLGLGLSIAKALIEAQHGAISASSDGHNKAAPSPSHSPLSPNPSPLSTASPPPMPPPPAPSKSSSSKTTPTPPAS